jgi:tetratricopeptide (TPR) repeat protein
MRSQIWIFGLSLLLAGGAWGQGRHKVDINAETPEGKALQEIGQEQDPAKRLALMDKFLGAHASHAGSAWVIGQSVLSAQKLNQHDRVIEGSTKLIALDGSDVEIAYAGLQAAVAKADHDLILKWAGTTAEAGKKATASPEPKDEEELERWKYRIAFSKPDQAPKRAEYEVFSAAMRSQDPATRVKMLDGLTGINPQSEYLASAPVYYFGAYRQLNQTEKALALAVKQAEANTADEDMLLFLANNAFEKKDQAAAIKYADQLAAGIRAKPAPAGMDAAAWEKKKGFTLGAGLWLKGMTLAAQSKWKDTDVTLRESIPLLRGNNDELLSHALFNAGLANYKMGSLNEAYKFMQECAALKGPKQGEAAKNAAVIRQQGGGAAPAKKGAGKK